MVNFHCKLVVSLLFFFCGYQSVYAERVTCSIISAVLQEKYNNTIFSPLLLLDGLWELYLGAQGNTIDAISRVLELSGRSKTSVILDYYNWRRNLIPDREVTCVNNLFIDRNININAKYEQLLQKIFKSSPIRMDFGNSFDTTHLINSWVAKETRNLITNLIEQTDNSMKIMFLSALYYKGLWKYPFDKLRTRLDNFYIPQQIGDPWTKQVDMMTTRGTYRINIIKQLDCTSFELPYHDSKKSMVILLPRQIDGINKLIDGLYRMDINDIAPKSVEIKATINMPKFQFDVKLDLNNALRKLGLGQLFSQANLSEMGRFNGIAAISEFIQRAVVVVDEVGSTANYPLDFGFPKPPLEVEYQINHPFVFLIKDDAMVYCAGRVTME